MTKLLRVLFVVLLAGVPIGGSATQQIREIGLPPFGGRAAFVADLQQRRERALAAFPPQTMVVLWSAPSRVYSNDQDYEYRQESNFLYLTGFARQSAVLLLLPGAGSPREVLFVQAPNAAQALWTGYVPTVADVQAATGIQHVFAQRQSEALDAFLAGFLGRTSGAEGAAFAAGVAARGANDAPVRVAMLDYRPAAAPDSVEASRMAAWVRSQRQLSGERSLEFEDAGARLRALRQIKTPYERDVLRRSVAISSEAHIEGMKATRPGRWEYEVEAAIEYVFLKNGALSWGYPSIVASGPNATTLHYLESTRQMEDGDLLLVDAAGNYQGLTGDITRTYPVNGRFTADQRALYEAVLAALEAGAAAATPGVRPGDIDRAVRRSLGASLLRLGLITDAEAPAQVSLWFPHSAVHGIGVDVHDPLERLEPGAAFVIEPGLYVRQDTFDRLEADPARAEFARAIRPAFLRFRDLGIRIEDSFLMTAEGVENLSSRVPRAASEIEQLVGTAGR